jgi:hypothetical protein
MLTCAEIEEIALNVGATEYSRHLPRASLSGFIERHANSYDPRINISKADRKDILSRIDELRLAIVEGREPIKPQATVILLPTASARIPSRRAGT